VRARERVCLFADIFVAAATIGCFESSSAVVRLPQWRQLIPRQLPYPADAADGRVGPAPDVGIATLNAQ